MELFIIKKRLEESDEYQVKYLQEREKELKNK